MPDITAPWNTLRLLRSTTYATVPGAEPAGEAQAEEVQPGEISPGEAVPEEDESTDGDAEG